MCFKPDFVVLFWSKYGSVLSIILTLFSACEFFMHIGCILYLSARRVISCDLRILRQFCKILSKVVACLKSVWFKCEAGLSQSWRYRAGGPVSKYIKFSKPVSSHGFDFPVRLFWVFAQSGSVIFEALSGLVLLDFRVVLLFAASSLWSDFVSIQLCWVLSCLACNRLQVMP